MQSLENSNYKIGISKHPAKRLLQLQTGNSSQLKLIDTYQSEYVHQIEKTLHRRYEHLHTEGEWFYMGINNEINFKNECKQIEENIIILKKNGNIFI